MRPEASNTLKTMDQRADHGGICVNMMLLCELHICNANIKFCGDKLNTGPARKGDFY